MEHACEMPQVFVQLHATNVYAMVAEVHSNFLMASEKEREKSGVAEASHMRGVYTTPAWGFAQKFATPLALPKVAPLTLVKCIQLVKGGPAGFKHNCCD